MPTTQWYVLFEVKNSRPTAPNFFRRKKFENFPINIAVKSFQIGAQ